jgi:hypothetical protein
MAAGLTQYEGAGEFYINGRLQAEASSCKVNFQSRDNEVMTMQKGFAGFSDGPARVEISVDCAIPKAGYEFDFFNVCVRKQKVRAVVVIAGQRKNFECRVTDHSETTSDSAAAGLSVTLVGKMIGKL